MTDKEKDIIHNHAPKFKKDIPMPPVKPAPGTNCNKELKMRENELYEPKIETEEWIAPHGWQAKAYCPNCETELSRSFEFSSKKNIAIDNALSYTPNYCPNCGARLKKVEVDE